MTLAHHRVSSSSVDHGGSWVEIPSGTRIFPCLCFSMYRHLIVTTAQNVKHFVIVPSLNLLKRFIYFKSMHFNVTGADLGGAPPLSRDDLRLSNTTGILQNICGFVQSPVSYAIP